MLPAVAARCGRLAPWHGGYICTPQKCPNHINFKHPGFADWQISNVLRTVIPPILPSFSTICSTYNITPEEKSQPLLFKPHQGITFASWDNQKWLNYTSFYSRDLRRIYNLFILKNLADDNGKNRIHNGHYNQDGHSCNYAVDLEELFLFKFKKLSHILDFVNDIFGRDHGRWKHACP